MSPVSKHHGLLQTLSAGLMEPLLTPETLQHLQVPPTHTTNEYGLIDASVMCVSERLLLLSRASTVTVTLLLVGPMLGVPVQRVQVVQ